MNNNTKKYYNSKQGRLPLFISDRLDICDPVLAFDKIMEEIGIEKYLKPEPLHKMGRPGYNRVNMLKTILFGFMDTGYASLRELEDRCRVNLRYMYLMDQETPSYRAFSYFINEVIKESVQIFLKPSSLISRQRRGPTCSTCISMVLNSRQMQTSTPGFGKKPLKNQDTVCLIRLLHCLQK